MKFTLFFFLLLFSQALLADHFRSSIHSIDHGEQDRPHLIKFNNGRVAFVAAANVAMASAMLESWQRNELVEVTLDHEYELQAATSVGEEAALPASSDQSPRTNLNYTPTVLPDRQSAQSIFNRMRRNHQRDSQCYNRAHIWAYEEHNRSGWKSMKLFLFFTHRYIRNYRYKWWFHVTPMARVGEIDMALDRTFTRGPLLLKNWTENFIYSKRNCPVVNKYSDYSNNQWAEDCYLIPVSMYYWQPRDIDRFERTGYEKQQFIQSEIRHAYWEAF
jgi:hypothetical protein